MKTGMTESQVEESRRIFARSFEREDTQKGLRDGTTVMRKVGDILNSRKHLSLEDQQKWEYAVHLTLRLLRPDIYMPIGFAAIKPDAHTVQMSMRHYTEWSEGD